MIYKIIFSLFLATFIQGCSAKKKPNTETLSQKISHSIGHDINEVISKAGQPSSVYTMPNGNQLYSFERSEIRTTPVVESSNFIGDQITTTGGDKFKYSCKIEFTVDKNTQKIIDYRLEGNACQ